MLWEGEGCRVVGEHRIETRAKELNRVCIKIVLAGLRSSWSLKRAASYAVLCLPSISGTPSSVQVNLTRLAAVRGRSLLRALTSQ